MKRYAREHYWIIDNNKRKTDESLIVYDEEWNTLDDICNLLNEKEQQLVEKDKEIKKRISALEYNENNLSNQRKTIRKQVCEEIRRKMTVYRYVEVKTKNGYEWALTDSDINEILDEIEQGEEV